MSNWLRNFAQAAGVKMETDQRVVEFFEKVSKLEEEYGLTICADDPFVTIGVSDAEGKFYDDEGFSF